MCLLIIDEKVAIMDTVDKRKTDEWLENLDRELNGRTPDYLVISHLEPDHASNIKVVSEKYPSMKLVVNANVFYRIGNFNLHCILSFINLCPYLSEIFVKSIILCYQVEIKMIRII